MSSPKDEKVTDKTNSADDAEKKKLTDKEKSNDDKLKDEKLKDEKEKSPQTQTNPPSKPSPKLDVDDDKDQVIDSPDDEQQTYILQNYSTLRTKYVQWNSETMDKIIKKFSEIKIVSPSIDVNRCVISKLARTMQVDKDKLDKCKHITPESSANEIIKMVTSYKLDPLLDDKNPFKPELDKNIDKKIEQDDVDDDDDDDDDKDDQKHLDKGDVIKSKISQIDAFTKENTIIISDKKDNNNDDNDDNDDDNGIGYVRKDLENDKCYQMVYDRCESSAALTLIKTNKDDTSGFSGMKNKNKNSKCCSYNEFKKGLKFTYQVGTRGFSLIDIVTDLLLLIISSSDENLWFLTIALVISMASPYIISYSSGVQLYLFRQTFDNVQGFKKVLMIFFLLPTGILYFVFLDLADIFIHIFRWVYFVLCCKSLQDIGQYEQVLSEQLGMDRMNWEGFKRQRSVGQLMFESLPQFIFQTIFFYFLWDDFKSQECKDNPDLPDCTHITVPQLLLSICSAFGNVVGTTIKLNLEARCCHTTIISYALNCVKARVGWVPQREFILDAATQQEERKLQMMKRLRRKKKKKKNANANDSFIDENKNNNNNNEPPEINYEMQYKVLWYKHSVEYDFSPTTIRYLMSALQMLNTSNNEDIHPLKINFQNSLRLLPLQDIIELYSLCQQKNIEVESIKGGSRKYKYKFDSAVEISLSYGKDVRLLSNARDDQGLPYIMKLMNLDHYPYGERREIFRVLIALDFDLNIHDLISNESIIYTLIRSYDYGNLEYIFGHYCKNKGILMRLNYHNKDGISPLGLALQHFDHEAHVRKVMVLPQSKSIKPYQVPYLWEILIRNGAELSFPCKKNFYEDEDDDDDNIGDMSPLNYVLKELKNKSLTRRLMTAGAQLYSKEIAELNELFVNYELEEEENWEEPPPIDKQAKKKDDDDDSDVDDDDDEFKDDFDDDNKSEWDKPDDYLDHSSDLNFDNSWINLLCDVCKHIGRPLEFVTDNQGDNPLHYFIKDYNRKHRGHIAKQSSWSHRNNNKLKIKRLKHLMVACPKWKNEKNNLGEYPFQLIVQKREAELFFEFAELDKKFKQSIMENKEFVAQMIDWIIAITKRITKKYPHKNCLKKNKKTHKYDDERVAKDMDVQTLDRMFLRSCLGKLIKWPNKYKQSTDQASIHLIDTCLDREEDVVTFYLKTYWKFSMKKVQREKLKEIKEDRENRKLLGIEYNRAQSRLKLNANKNKNKKHKLIKQRTNDNQVSSQPTGVVSNILRPDVKGGGGVHQNQLSNTTDVLAKAPAAVLRQHTLPVVGGSNNNILDDDDDDDVNGKTTQLTASLSSMVNIHDVDMMRVVDRIQVSSKNDPEGMARTNKLKKSKIETIYSFVVEALSTADFVTDILVVMQLMQYREVWWLTLMLLFMIAPYLVSHSIMCSLIDSRRTMYSLEMANKKDGAKCCSKCGLVVINVLALILMTPFAILWFAFVDITFMIYITSATIIFLITCAKIDISDYMDDLLFRKWLGMSRMQIVGYRRLRTLSQLLFETFPQIILQFHILYSFSEGLTKIELQVTELYISIGVAILHVILEAFIIYLDARASEMSLLQYAVTCLGARLNWVPFGHQIRTDRKPNQDYNFEKIEWEPWFFKCCANQKYRIEYEFSPSSIKKLGEYFIGLPILSSTRSPSNPILAPVWLYYKELNRLDKRLPVVRLGETCCRSLDVYSFAEFFRSADKKVTLYSSHLDWRRVIFENTANTSSSNVYLKRLCEEFINYAEIKLITLLAPIVKLNSINIKKYILSRGTVDILLILKKYYDENIQFGLNNKTITLLYQLIENNHWIHNYKADPTYAKVIFLFLWYTRRTIYRHQDPKGNFKFIDDNQRLNFFNKAIKNVLPVNFTITYDSNVDIPVNIDKSDGIDKMRTIINASKDTKISVNDEKDPTNADEKEREGSIYKLPADYNEKQPSIIVGKTVTAVPAHGENLDTGFLVPFEILECFKYFQPQIESFLIASLCTKSQRHRELIVGDRSLFTFYKKSFSKQSVDFLKLVINSPWNVLQKFPVHVRFAELFCRLDPVIRRLEMVHGYGKYLLASSKYRQSNADKPMQFIIANDYDNFESDDDDDAADYLEHEQNVLDSSNSNFTISGRKEILNIQTDPAYHGHTTFRTASINFADDFNLDMEQKIDGMIQLTKSRSNNTMRKHTILKKYRYDKSDIMGISRIEISFEDFEFQYIKPAGGLERFDTYDIADDNSDSDDDYDNDNKDNNNKTSLGKIELFTVLPTKTIIPHDRLILNKVVLGEITFEELAALRDKGRLPKLIVDIYDNQVLGSFRPIYVGRDGIELMPLKLYIKPINEHIHIKCDEIHANITYVLRKFKDATSMKFENVVHYAVMYQNIEFLQFIREYQDVFDCGEVDDHYQNALHLLGNSCDPDLDIFNIVVNLRDIDINHIRYDGKTPFKVVEGNRKIDIEKKNEMLKQISNMKNYRPLVYNKKNQKDKKKLKKGDKDNKDNKDDDDDDDKFIKNVLLLGEHNSGKHSLLKHIFTNHVKAYTLWEKTIYRTKIIKYLVESMKTLIKHCGDDDIARLKNMDAAKIYGIRTDNLQTIEHLESDCFESLIRLWAEASIKKVYSDVGSHLNLTSSIRYFFDHRLKYIKKSNYIPSNIDILRAPINDLEKTILESRTYKIDDEASDISIRWIVPSNNKIFKLSHEYNRNNCKPLDDSDSETDDEDEDHPHHHYGHNQARRVITVKKEEFNNLNKYFDIQKNTQLAEIDTVVFIVSLTSFLDINRYKNNDNNFIYSLKLFKEFCENPRYNKTKFVLLLNKTDVFRTTIKNIVKKPANSILKSLDINDYLQDYEDYYDWLDLIQAMFRYQHSTRTVFSYPLSASDPSKARSILKELEDIILQDNVPTIQNVSNYEQKVLRSVKWIATVNISTNKDNNLAQFKFELKLKESYKSLLNNPSINIDYNAMLYKTITIDKKNNNRKIKNVHFLISIDSSNIGLMDWAVWKKSKMDGYLGAKGYWKLIDDDNYQNLLHLNGILSILHHKELRTQIDGFTINANPIEIIFYNNDNSDFNKYNVSWWNMRRKLKCNAIIVDNSCYLNFKSPKKDPNIKWLYYDNDKAIFKDYDASAIRQLECSFQANLESNYPRQILQAIDDKLNKKDDKVEEEKDDLKQQSSIASSAIMDDDEEEQRIFNHCILTDFQRFMREKVKQIDAAYILKFGFNSQNQISNMDQVRIRKNDNGFARDVQRRYNGRNSTWPN